MRAAVCDDDRIILGQIEELIGENDFYHSEDGYTSAEELAEAVRSGKKYDVIFLDVELGASGSGIDFAERLKKLLPNAWIVFVTAYPKYSQDIFLREINLAGFLLKPVDREHFDALTGQLRKKVRDMSARKLVLTFRQRNLTIPTNEILYIESSAHQAIIHLAGGQSELCYEKLTELEKKLPSSFAQCHQSYLVNLEEVTSLESDSVVLSGGIAIPVSRSRLASFRDAYFRYIGSSV